jgi:hypothetical protein
MPLHKRKVSPSRGPLWVNVQHLLIYPSYAAQVRRAEGKGVVTFLRWLVFLVRCASVCTRVFDWPLHLH